MNESSKNYRNSVIFSASLAGSFPFRMVRRHTFVDRFLLCLRMATGQQSYPPIDDYALISDCHSVAMISRSGSVDWCCMARIDNDSTFGRLLDWGKGGFWSITPTEEEFTATRAYEPDTLILTTEFQ